MLYFEEDIYGFIGADNLLRVLRRVVTKGEEEFIELCLINGEDECALKYGPIEEGRLDHRLDNIDMNMEENLAVPMDYFTRRPAAMSRRI